jgi:osmoprotectant transport system permease protein
MQDKPLIDWAWIFSHLDDIALRLLQHVELTIVPVFFGFLIAMAIAIWAIRRPVIVAPVTTLTGILYTIPSIAAFAFLRPIFGLSLLTAIIPLTTYTLLILFRSNVAGFKAVPAEVLEAAEGMGYTSRQRLRRVEIPLAIPLMITGLRLATVTTVGLATVAAILGDSYGGLGQFITEGLQTFFPTKIYVGGVLSVLLAFAFDVLFVRIERRATPWAHARAARG